MVEWFSCYSGEVSYAVRASINIDWLSAILN